MCLYFLRVLEKSIQFAYVSHISNHQTDLQVHRDHHNLGLKGDKHFSAQPNEYVERSDPNHFYLGPWG